MCLLIIMNWYIIYTNERCDTQVIETALKFESYAVQQDNSLNLFSKPLMLLETEYK